MSLLCLWDFELSKHLRHVRWLKIKSRSDLVFFFCKFSIRTILPCWADACRPDKIPEKPPFRQPIRYWQKQNEKHFLSIVFLIWLLFIRKLRTRSSVKIKFVTSVFLSSRTVGAVGDDDWSINVFKVNLIQSKNNQFINNNTNSLYQT